MAETAKLVGEKRDTTGTSASRKMRSAGRIPGNLYGLGRECVNFSVAEEALRPLINSDVKVVDLDLDGTTELALFREIQWDTFSRDVQHFDLQRVDPTKRIRVELALELRGTSPGVLGGGVLDLSTRTVEVECLAHNIPDHIYVKISELQIGDAVHVSDLEVPEGAAILDDPATLVVRVNSPVEEEEVEETVEGAAEPELVGRQAETESPE